MAETTEKYFPFDGTDREYKAEDFARYYKAFITSGVFMNISTSLQAVADSGMNIKVKAGAGIINGYRYDNTADLSFTLDVADGLLNRIDRIVFRWDKENREISLKVLKGTPASAPAAPAVTRNSDIIEYAVADIAVNAGVVAISQSDITDKRMDSTVCGEALPWAELDTSTLAAQYEAWVQEAMEEGDAAAQELLEEMRDILDGSAAGHLQNEIDNLQGQITTLDGAVTDLQNKVAVRTFTVATTNWEANAGTDATEFPYVANIATTVYSNNFIPAEMLLLGADISDYMTSAELEAKDLVDAQVKFTATAIRLRATAAPASALTLVIRG